MKERTTKLKLMNESRCSVEGPICNIHDNHVCRLINFKFKPLQASVQASVQACVRAGVRASVQAGVRADVHFGID